MSQKLTLPTTIIPLVDQLWLPLSETSITYANVEQLFLDTSSTANQAFKEGLEKNFDTWKSGIKQEDKVMSLFLYDLRFNNVTLKQSLQQWTYPIVNEYYEVPGIELEEGRIPLDWKAQNEYTDKMCQMYERDMLNYVKDKMKNQNISIENLDISPSTDLLTMEELKLRRMITLPLFQPNQKTLLFIHTCNSSFQYELQPQ